jgi:hypothetical protein
MDKRHSWMLFFLDPRRLRRSAPSRRTQTSSRGPLTLDSLAGREWRTGKRDQNPITSRVVHFKSSRVYFADATITRIFCRAGARRSSPLDAQDQRASLKAISSSQRSSTSFSPATAAPPGDNVLSADVVTANGHTIHCDDRVHHNRRQGGTIPGVLYVNVTT